MVSISQGELIVLGVDDYVGRLRDGIQRLKEAFLLEAQIPAVRQPGIEGKDGREDRQDETQYSHLIHRQPRTKKTAGKEVFDHPSPAAIIPDPDWKREGRNGALLQRGTVFYIFIYQGVFASTRS